MNLNDTQSPVVAPQVLSTPGLGSPPAVFSPLGNDNRPAAPAPTFDNSQNGRSGSLQNHRPLRTLFVITSMPVGGAETLLVNMLDRFDSRRILAEVACLKSPGPLGEAISDRHQVHSGFLGGKWDVRVFPRLVRLMHERSIDAVITIGAGDKMFWGRLAAKFAGVPVICSALHSTGWPDGVGRINRLLTPITDGFIAVADHHGVHLIKHERFPEKSVHIIRNGIDCQRFVPSEPARTELRRQLGLSAETKLVGIVAALRPEKNHALFVAVAAAICKAQPNVHFVIVGDGPERQNIQQAIDLAGIQDRVHLLGTRHDTPAIVAGLDIFLLTSDNEASPVSILEALSCGVPVISTNVGSVSETVRDGETGYLVATGDTQSMVRRVRQLLGDDRLRHRLGQQGRKVVMNTGSLDSMVEGYTRLVESLYGQKTGSKQR